MASTATFAELKHYVTANARTIQQSGAARISTYLNRGKREKDKDKMNLANFLEVYRHAFDQEQEAQFVELEAQVFELGIATGSRSVSSLSTKFETLRQYISDNAAAIKDAGVPRLLSYFQTGNRAKDDAENKLDHFIRRNQAMFNAEQAAEYAAWEEQLCAHASDEASVSKFKELLKRRFTDLRNMQKSSLEELFTIHARKKDPDLRFGYDFMTRVWPRLALQVRQEILEIAKPILVGPQVKSQCAPKMHKDECPLPDDLPRPRLPKSLRQLYGNSSAAEQRIMTYYHRVSQMDEFLLDKHRFQACDYCKNGWFGTNLPKTALPGGFETQTYKKTNFLVVSNSERLHPGKDICRNCWNEAQDRRKAGLSPEPVRYTGGNYMDPGPTLPETDALSFFEEEILSPIQHIIRIFTLYATGQVECRGHVGNMMQNGPQYVRQIPALVGDMKYLLIRRCPKSPYRKQRVPFLASAKRLERALDRVARPAEEGGSLAFQPGALTSRGFVDFVKRENLAQYSNTEQGEEPEGMQVIVVEQEQLQLLDFSLFRSWMALSQALQINVQIRAEHEPEGVSDPVIALRETWNSFRKAVRDFGGDCADDPAAGSDAESGAIEQSTEKCSNRRDRALQLEHVAQYLSSWVKITGDSSHLEVLKDELTCVQEAISWEDPISSEGFWAPENMDNRSSEVEMKEDLWESVLGAHSADASTRGSTIRQAAGRVPGLPILDPPTVASVNSLIREDQPYYIVAGFLKIFPLGKADYWAWVHARQQQGLSVSLWEWIKHMMFLADGRCQSHPRFYFFALNTALRNKALRSRSYFVKRQTGQNVNEAYTSEQLFKMGKQAFVKLVSAFEHSIAGSTQEKVQQRSDLEAMCEQIEQVTRDQHISELKNSILQAQSILKEGRRRKAPDLGRLEARVKEAAEQLCDCAPFEIQVAETSVEKPSEISIHGGDLSTKSKEIIDLLYELGQRVQVGGEIPCHFTTLTTAIYQWQDLAQVLEVYERETTKRRGGRQDPWEPSERKLSPHKRRVLRYPGVVAWYTCYKIELFFTYVMQNYDRYGVYEWGPGGIMHLHSLNVGSFMPRINPGEHTMLDESYLSTARRAASVHEEYITEWDLNLAEKWSVEPVERKKPTRTRRGELGEPLQTDSESDGSEDLAGSSGHSLLITEGDRADVVHSAAGLRDDEDFQRRFPTPTSMVYVTNLVEKIRYV